MRLTKNEGGEVDLPTTIDWIIEDDPPGQTKLTNAATGAVWNVKESIAEVREAIAKEKTKP